MTSVNTFVFALLFPLFALAGVTADGPIVLVNNPASTDYQNVQEIIKFLNFIGEAEQAKDLSTALASSRLFHGPNLKYNGGKVKGLTSPSLQLYFDSSLV